MGNIKISIITATFNRGEVLINNLKSVGAQSLSKLEHIIIDNNSNDNTEEIVNDYKKKAKYPVIYLREADTGIYTAFNKGIKIARGEWIHFLNSDDCYISENILIKIFEEGYDGYDLIVCPVILTKENSDNKIWYPRFNEKLSHYYFPHTGTIFKKSFFDRVGLYDERYKIISDSIFGIKNYPNAKYVILNSPLVFMSNSGISGSISFTLIKERIIATLVYHKYPLSKKIYFILVMIYEILIECKNNLILFFSKSKL